MSEESIATVITTKLAKLRAKLVDMGLAEQGLDLSRLVLKNPAEYLIVLAHRADAVDALKKQFKVKTLIPTVSEYPTATKDPPTY